jgi:hypothetical protein
MLDARSPSLMLDEIKTGLSRRDSLITDAAFHKADAILDA